MKKKKRMKKKWWLFGLACCSLGTIDTLLRRRLSSSNRNVKKVKLVLLVGVWLVTGDLTLCVLFCVRFGLSRYPMMWSRMSRRREGKKKRRLYSVLTFLLFTLVKLQTCGCGVGWLVGRGRQMPQPPMGPKFVPQWKTVEKALRYCWLRAMALMDACVHACVAVSVSMMLYYTLCIHISI
jgi:hypothetical protein